MNLFFDAFAWILDPANWEGRGSIPQRIGECARVLRMRAVDVRRTAALQPVGDAPLVQRPLLLTADAIEQAEQACLLLGLDDDDREARMQQQLQVVQVVHGRGAKVDADA